jgi:predicted Fe-S protein YdhL (DUF1289 family)
MAAIVSPCTRLCTIDPATQLCAGCGRTLNEIGNWMRYDDAKRRNIMARLPERLASMERGERQESPQ